MNDARPRGKVLTPTQRKKAIAERAERRRRNKNILRKQNDGLVAGQMMYFYCVGCGAEMVRPENYPPPYPKQCPDCAVLGDEP